MVIFFLECASMSQHRMHVDPMHNLPKRGQGFGFELIILLFQELSHDFGLFKAHDVKPIIIEPFGVRRHPQKIYQKVF